MISQRFLQWKDTANVAKRAAAASALGRAYLQCEMDFEDRCGAEAALTLLADDPSPKVRFALAEALALGHRSPPQVIAAFLHDRFEIASMVASRSPVVCDQDLEMVVPGASDALQAVIAKRPNISKRLIDALINHGGRDAACALLSNPTARIEEQGLKRLVERLGEDAGVRGALLDRSDLPVVYRYRLMCESADALASAPLFGAIVPASRLERKTAEAVSSSLMNLINLADSSDYAELSEAMRELGDLNTSLLIRAACFGKMDFLAEVLASLSGQTLPRVTGIFVQDRETPLLALLQAAGFSQSVQPILIEAICLWKKVAQGHLQAGPQEITFRLSEALKTRAKARMDAANDDIQSLLRSIYLETMRTNARSHAIALSQAA